MSQAVWCVHARVREQAACRAGWAAGCCLAAALCFACLPGCHLGPLAHLNQSAHF